ncbi:hypothetical protein ACIBCM_14935 [Streptomyces sp. NPDC051018]|uniref:hypothetical protein n=1 Tax=Streptomyces sp. NPDC051018 TaxID=3365639 RepID=UPI0037A25D00
MDVRVWRTGMRLRIEVGTAGAATPPMREPEALEESGRGLSMVAVLADGWGVVPGGAWCALVLNGRP